MLLVRNTTSAVGYCLKDFSMPSAQSAELAWLYARTPIRFLPSCFATKGWGVPTQPRQSAP